MPTIAERNVILKFKADTANAQKNTDKLGKSVKGLGAITTQAIATFAGFAALQGIQRLGSEISGLASKSVSLAISAEQTQVAFTTFLGSAEKAKEVIAELNEFSELTPFTPDEVLKSGQALLAFGIEAEDLTKTLQRVGDISAGTGTQFTELAEIFGKAKTQGRLFNEDINQLTGRGIPIIAEFAKQFGVAEGEIKKLAASGAISFENLEEAFTSLTSEGGKFFNLTAAQSQTLGGRISTLKGQFDALLRTIGENLAPTLGRVVDTFSRFTQLAKEYLEVPVSEELQDERLELQKLSLKLQDTNTSSEERVAIIKELQSQYPDYLKNIDAETASNEDLLIAIDDINNALVKRIAIQIQEEELTESVRNTTQALKAQESAYDDTFTSQVRLIEEFKKLGIETELTGKSMDEVTAILASQFEQARRNGTANQELLLAASDLFERNKDLTSTTNILTEAQAVEAESLRDLNKLQSDLSDALVKGEPIKRKDTKAVKSGTDAIKERTKALKDFEKRIKRLNKEQKANNKLIEESQKVADDFDPAEARADTEAENIQKRIELEREASALRVKEALRTGENITSIEESFNLEILRLEAELIEARLLATEDGSLERLKLNADLAEKEKEIARASLETFRKNEDEKQDSTKKTRDLQLDNARMVLDATAKLNDAAIGGLKDVLLAEKSALDAKIEAQTKAVADSVKLAETGSTELLEVEERRLNELTEQRRRNAEQLRVINQIQVISNQALAVSQGIVAVTAAFKEGNVIKGVATSVALAATIASGIVAINNAFSDAPAFATGTDYFEGQGSGTSDSNIARISKGERIVPANMNAKYFDTLSEFQRGTQTADLLHSIASGQMTIPFVDSGNSGESDDRLLRQIEGMRKSIDKLSINVSLDSDGFNASIERMNRKAGKFRRKLGA